MGLLGWLFGSNDNKSSQRASYYYERQENMKKNQEARERWANTQKEMYKTTGLIMVPEGADSGTNGAGSIDDEAEFEDTANELTNESENLQKDIETYKADKADAISHYANPG